MSKPLIYLIICLFLTVQCASRKEIAQFKKDLFYLQQIQQDTNTLKRGMTAQQISNEEIKRTLDEVHNLILELQDQTSRTKAELLTETGNLRAQSSVLDSKLDDDINRLSRFIQKIESRNITKTVKDTTTVKN